MRVLSWRLGGALAAAALLFATACGNEANEATVTPPPPEAPESPAATDASGQNTTTGQDDERTTVTTTLVDYEIQLSQTTFTPGTYTFEIVQEGEQPHALAIAGQGLEARTGTLEEVGDSTRLTLTLQPGTYELWCPISNHRELGMETTIEVS